MTDTPRRRRAYAPRVGPGRRREDLLDAALDLVVSRGHDAATVDGVAAAAGVSKPVLYGVFDGRADLLAALLRRETRQALGQLATVLTAEPAPLAPDAGTTTGTGTHPDPSPDPDPAEWAARTLTRFLDAVREAPRRWHCVVMPMPGMPAEFHAARDAARRRVLGQVAELVEAAVDAGALRRGIDVEITAHAVVGLGETAARLLLSDPQAHSPARFGDALRAALGSPPRTAPTVE